MTTTYNVNIFGSLTNNNGVLSGFSSGNYATLSKTFNPSAQIALEIVFKFNSNDISDEQIIFQMGNISTADGFIDIEIYNSKLYFEFDSENTQRCYIEGVTALSSNADYWAKLTYDGVNTYALSLSADGITWNTEGTVNSWYYLVSAQNSYIGINQDLSQWYFNGSIDLNGCYINVDGVIWWRGSENITKIQLRHDTAANWTSVNPILLDGEVGIETDTRKQKFGDGVTAWNSLPYDKGSTALQSITSSDVTTALGYTPVNKAGDTMGGALTTTKLNISNMNQGAISLKNITSGNFSDVTFYDDNDTRIGFIRGNNVSSTVNNTQISVVDKNNTVGGTLILTNNNGTNSASLNTTLTANNLISNGSLTTSGDINLGGGGRMNLKVNGTSKGTTPSSNCYQAFLFNDSDTSHTTWQSQRFGACETQVLNTGENRLLLSVYKNEANSTAGATLTLATSSNGSWCTFPNTTCVDGQWVQTSVNLANNVSLPVGNDQEITYDLSSALPNDSYKYEVVLNYVVQTGNSSGAGLAANIIGSGDSIWHRICDTYARGSWYMNAGGNVVVTVGTTRTVTFKYTAVSKAGQLNYLYVEGYKRKGTNS